MACLKKEFFAACLAIMLVSGPGAYAQDYLTENEPSAAELQELQEFERWAEETLAKLHPQTGEIELPNGVATLQVPDNFYYLDAQEAEVVLTEIWGNPATEERTLGMLFPAESTPFDSDAWGVTIEYVEEGFVNDEDAADINYGELLSSMKEDIQRGSEWRVNQGYEAIALIDWAKPPYYDAENKKLYWAKELQFGDSPDHTLNYNIRILGRKGYLLLNFIASMDQLNEIDQNLDTVLGIAEFNQGSRYSDFDPDIDQVAAYGIGALVAGKVLAKTGLIAMGLIFLKKFWFILALGGSWLVKAFVRKRKNPR